MVQSYEKDVIQQKNLIEILLKHYSFDKLLETNMIQRKWIDAQYLASKTHDYALKEEEGKTFLNINCAVMGLGNSSCGPGVLKKYAIDPNKKHQLRIRILDWIRA